MPWARALLSGAGIESGGGGGGGGEGEYKTVTKISGGLPSQSYPT